MSIESAFRHQCRLETHEVPAEEDVYSVAGPGKVGYVEVSCLFLRGEGESQLGESGRYIKRAPVVLLPATVLVTEGLKLIGLSEGWTKKFVVRFADPVTIPELSHYRCDIEVVPA